MYVSIDSSVNFKGDFMVLEKFQQQNKIKQNSIVAAGVEEFSQKTYSDANTDKIVQNCGISKGFLFHYFGSKKNFYFYCLSQSLEKLLEQTDEAQGNFYEILFSVMFLSSAFSILHSSAREDSPSSGVIFMERMCFLLTLSNHTLFQIPVVCTYQHPKL